MTVLTGSAKSQQTHPVQSELPNPQNTDLDRRYGAIGIAAVAAAARYAGTGKTAAQTSLQIDQRFVELGK